MKWPEMLTLVRHGESAYNQLRSIKNSSPQYIEFKIAYDLAQASGWSNPEGKALIKRMAEDLRETFRLPFGDKDTPLTEQGIKQARQTGYNLEGRIPKPDVILVSPYLRTRDTLKHIKEGWKDLESVDTYIEERLVEQGHGLSTMYNDWRIFNAIYQEQREYREQEGSYQYRHPQGENVPDVRLRLHSLQDTLVREFSGQNVLMVTHHLTILSLMTNLERFDEEEFQFIDEQLKPINCGVTIYRGYPNEGKDGHLKLDRYNMRLY